MLVFLRSIISPSWRARVRSRRLYAPYYFPHHTRFLPTSRLGLDNGKPHRNGISKCLSTFLEIFYSFTDQLRKATTGQSGPEKFSIMLSNVSHTIECIAPITSDDDPDLAALYSRQDYLDERQQQALGELSSLPRCDTPGCRVHLPPVILPLKI
ncbi:hypothetical protein TNCV_4097621 [Trichonephila clavipes]|nr:hypothetical protein TNCV_4097621 [Trichonephila clavipes]